MPAPLSVTIIYNKQNTFSLAEDVTIIEKLLTKIDIGQTLTKPRVVDAREPLSHSDIQFHLEVPVYSAISYAHTNVLLVNPKQWLTVYDSYVHAFDALLFRDSVSAERFSTELVQKGIAPPAIHTIPWASTWQVNDVVYGADQAGFVCFLGGSSSKFEYVKTLVPLWKESDPVLTIYTTRKDFSDVLEKERTTFQIKVICQDINKDVRRRVMANYRGHLIVSEAESFGYTAAEAEVAGAFAIMNELPVFSELYKSTKGIAWLSNVYHESTTKRCSLARPSSTIREELDRAFEQFRSLQVENIRKDRQRNAVQRFPHLCSVAQLLFHELQKLVQVRRPSKGVFHCPPLLQLDDCPPITIVTPTYNRKKLFEIAFHNILITDYPHDKLEWIVIEDADQHSEQMVGEDLMSFQVQVPKIQIKYIPIQNAAKERLTIGEKRNLAIEKASHDIVLFMDDDDHYPTTSFRRRVAWLTKGVKRGRTEQKMVCCTTLALYDLNRGVSGVNVPPFDIPFAQRISEATLTFYKSAWEERRFPNVSLAEGEHWIDGRECDILEIPPQQIIVAFSHGTNQSSRRLPPSNQAPSCFWGFPKEYLIFIHGLVGVQIEEDSSSKKPSKKK
jgi:hypothetical protein